jgi:uncharacterized protein (TIGR03382 family)
VTDTGFTAATSFTPPGASFSASFVTIVPEPGQATLSAVAALALWLGSRRR